MSVVTFGEIMLRLAPPGHERLLQSARLEATFGGSEANVAVALCALGQNARFVTALPDNRLAEACLGELRRFGVDTSCIVRRAGRMGLYFVEHGAAQRPSQVLYDREGSAMALARRGEFDWAAILDRAEWFHITGITPAISTSSAELAREAVEAARARGVPVSIDLNYRKNLWKWGASPQEIMPGLARSADVLIANEEDVQKALGLEAPVDVRAGSLDLSHYERLTARVLEEFPRLRLIAVTLRESYNASHNGWAACLRDGSEFVASRRYDIAPIVDRVGAGDAFAAGLIYGLLRLPSHKEALEFAAALGCLKHSIPGDFCRISAAEVHALLREGGSGRVER